jgi:hypothetical protein
MAEVHGYASWRSSPRRACGGRADTRHERASFAGRGPGERERGRIRRRCPTASSSRRRGGIGLGDRRRSGCTCNGHQGQPQSEHSRPGVVNPGLWRGARSSDSDGWGLHMAGSGQPAGPRRSTALTRNRVGRRTPAWARLNRVEGGDSRRTGPSRTMTQDVPLEVGHVYVPTIKDYILIDRMRQ